MNIIIPMAGQGTRLRPHTLTSPKPLLCFAGKAMVEHIIDELSLSVGTEINEIGFVCGHFGKEAEEALLECAAKKGAKGHIFYQDEPLGTGHAILCAKELLKGEVLVAFADTLFIGSENMLDCEQEGVIFTNKVENPQAFGVVVADETGRINAFVEKPKVFISDEAIIGIYYFKDGKNLHKELQYLIDTDFRRGKEYQLTDALENMLQKGLSFARANVEQWLDCGNKDATIDTHTALFKSKPQLHSVSASAEQKNSKIIEPCFIAKGVVLENAIIGPCVSIEKNCIIKNSNIDNSILQQEIQVENANLQRSMIGNKATVKNHKGVVSLGDYSQVE
ncbi:MAG: NTP transferase domain-containing protein [Bacteroidales bacterium]|jgi:glucose-1-phosphate thymidylyltransferase|nr:NTP transferase domain-containing protein [Bacteroidales bacterium]